MRFSKISLQRKRSTAGPRNCLTGVVGGMGIAVTEDIGSRFGQSDSDCGADPGRGPSNQRRLSHQPKLIEKRHYFRRASTFRSQRVFVSRKMLRSRATRSLTAVVWSTDLLRLSRRNRMLAPSGMEFVNAILT